MGMTRESILSRKTTFSHTLYEISHSNAAKL